MDQELIDKLAKMMRVAGPFTDYHKDEAVLKQVIAWAGDDWIRWRTLLNFTHDHGVALGETMAIREIDYLRNGAEFRIRENWKRELKGKTT
jgi:hypothetical protein